MPYDTLITAAELRALDGACVLLDCSFDLADPGAGLRAYTASHLPGALYASLDDDLSGPRTADNQGRHPLPSRATFAATAASWGIQPGVQVVAYDGQGGSYAARTWWLLRWLGHDAVAVLDGGASAWLAAGGVLTADVPAARPRPTYPALPAGMATITAAALLPQLGAVRVLDARAAERFLGDVEPLDPVAGHIPGATNRFFKDNLQRDGHFKPAAELRQEFEALGIVAGQASHVVQQCGSGVTACHNLLAMAHAGLGDSTLYPGSWSDWCSDPTRPVARG